MICENCGKEVSMVYGPVDVWDGKELPNKHLLRQRLCIDCFREFGGEILLEIESEQALKKG